MSHFSVLVAVPGVALDEDVSSTVHSCLGDIMEPYCESTEDPAFLQFVDVEDASRDEYNTGETRAVRFPDGHLESVHCSSVRERFDFDGEHLSVSDHHSKEFSDEELSELLQRCELIVHCPYTQLYPTFDKFMEDWHGYSKRNVQKRYGYYSNPNATWDWYQIGGRWPGEFLVKAENTNYVSSEDSGEESTVPGFTSCSGARKRDICWDRMKEVAQEELRAKYHNLCEMVAGIRKPEGLLHVEDGAVYGWNAFPLLEAGETEEHYLKRNRAGADDMGIPGFYAYVDIDGEWHSQGDMGWWGISSNDKPETDWNAECLEFIQDQHENTVFVMVDCHI